MRYLIFLIVFLAVVWSKISRKNHKDYFEYDSYDSCYQTCKDMDGRNYLTRNIWGQGVKYNCCKMADCASEGTFNNRGLTPGKCRSDPIDVGACHG